jgi:hypothetical protein
MAVTDKYEFETTEGTGTTGWNAIYAANFQKVESYMHTYIRLPMYTGEVVQNFDPLCVQNGYWMKAQADGSRQPALALAVSGEWFYSGEYVRGQRVGMMTNPLWNFAGSGYVYLGATGELTQTPVGGHEQIVGVCVDQTTIFVTL